MEQEGEGEGRVEKDFKEKEQEKSELVGASECKTCVREVWEPLRIKNNWEGGEVGQGTGGGDPSINSLIGQQSGINQFHVVQFLPIS